jgi:hypothetical protein
MAQNADSASLLEALEFVTSDTKYVSFTNWELIKTYEGVAELSGQDAFDKRSEFYNSLLSTRHKTNEG